MELQDVTSLHQTHSHQFSDTLVELSSWSGTCFFDSVTSELYAQVCMPEWFCALFSV